MIRCWEVVLGACGLLFSLVLEGSYSVRCTHRSKDGPCGGPCGGQFRQKEIQNILLASSCPTPVSKLLYTLVAIGSYIDLLAFSEQSYLF
jgi:hypothetical protein